MLLTWQPIDQISSVLWLLLSHCTVKAMRHHLKLLNDTQISTSASSGENTAHHSSSLGTAEILSAFCNNELTTHYLSNVTLNVLKVRSFTSSIFSVIIELTKIAYRPQWIPVIIFLFIFFFIFTVSEGNYEHEQISATNKWQLSMKWVNFIAILFNELSKH